MLPKSSLILALLPSLITALNIRSEPNRVITGDPVLAKREPATVVSIPNGQFSAVPGPNGDDMSVASECVPSTCPYNSAAVDLRNWQGAYTLHVNDCGECFYIPTSSAGCLDFSSCGRPQAICFDPSQGRMHRIWKDANVKKCYRVETFQHSLTCATPDHGQTIRIEETVTSPVEEVGCTW
ncbi:uncharacterized protein EI97DRAFT_121414 [Westerdykella ornata]|uniref:Uncharacterized protein n=1 Tax=Westerdykella ornata TaxID=318751 RepID=A0A6A6JVW8_WESOR|nr:uncharacterized protein EI97DRAFT_121414 [Westerdykella ornata]KAF2280375.1 hypothetical protein EI97DRAFT_121414 [Westerdykella ornata]